MLLATQYYRPPFPNKKYWKNDLRKMKESGLNALQLWAPWGWCEPEPGVFRFQDYDELVNLARKNGLGVVISTIAEIHPYWLLREYPDAVMIDHTGRKVSSGPRGECIVGLTPGGCTDNPNLARAMETFLKTIAMRYASAKNLLGWDAWNELRWHVGATGYVCYCRHTLKAFRDHLKDKYKSLDGLNAAWKRRYCSWDDVEPGRIPRSPYTEIMEFARFLTLRAKRHADFRCRAIKSADSDHPVLAHAGGPANDYTANGFEQPISRGNDFDLADVLDGFGCSHFPFWWQTLDEYGFGLRVETSRAAARGKICWVSELQGGSSRTGHTAEASVAAAPQQRWVWNSYARGAKAVIFWCWRDEVFGSESSGFGLDGSDGLAAERLKAMKVTGKLLEQHDELLQAYAPDQPRAAVVFEPDCYYLDWAENGEQDYAPASHQAYLRIMEHLHIPYEVLESSHLGALEHLKLVVLPWSLVVKPQLAEQLVAFVKRGGTLICEAETDCFDPLGFYRYPGPERSFAHRFGLSDGGRRRNAIDDFEVKLGGKSLKIKTSQWLTPLDWKGAATISPGTKLAAAKKVGQGHVYVLGTSAGHAYARSPYADLELFVGHLAAQAGALPDFRITPPGKKGTGIYQFRTGLSGDKRLFFIINGGNAGNFKIEGPAHALKGVKAVRDLAGNKKIPLKAAKGKAGFTVAVAKGGYVILATT